MTSHHAEIYYFSGSGNSLYVARNVAEKVNAKLTSIPSVIEKERIELDADVLGLVFPVYYATNDCGIPLIVRRFVKKLENLGSKYVFAVCTCGYMPGTTMENLRKVVASQGGELACGFIVRTNNKSLPSGKKQKLEAEQRKKLETINGYVAQQKRGRFETRGILRKLAFALPLHIAIKPVFSRRYRKLSGIKQHLPFPQLIPIADKSFQTNEHCNGCGVCAKVCPVGNIRLVDGVPVWQHQCETCYACYVWCPKGAIGGEIAAYNERYHHPDVRLSDMLEK